MQFSNILGFAACFAFASALPTVERRTGSTGSVSIIFHGAAGAQYSLNVPLDGSSTPTNNVLSISSVSSSYDVAKYCKFKTVDYPPALVEGPPGTWQVGPPQTVISVSCTGPTPIPPVQTATIQFLGAADGKYSLTIPLDGTVIPTNNVLSISTIKTDFQGLPFCDIKYVDFKAALSKIATDTWAVGPPQTIISIACWPKLG